ncbi:P-loop containing nucleoside triphosphate hydrolase protein [Mycena galopus ATCC 62051]|nr:P-loop containing nucleoside triphosphate hydrolase protein [Mycena galopus ATCC 62051]
MPLAPHTVPQTITRCPPPSRIFQGRQTILQKMHQFFSQHRDKQQIFLLHGLGGAGKTQIALKFIEGSSSQFSGIFLIDTSTFETIERGLKNIAATQSAGSTAQDGLQWLTSNTEEWLLVFDNADDPTINLDKFLPHCSHGNILITSRNPGLRGLAGANSLVSDMEEPDAVELLLKSAAEEPTPRNKGMASTIVKALHYLPLAIIQAGAFITESGALGSYLELYTENQAQLLSKKPAQSHDDYALTVYTTWQISFEQLSKPAATLLQLWSFLHHEGISEQVFSRASRYEVQPNGPPKEELQEALEFLSQFVGPTGAWDSFRFVKVTNEMKAYSLVNFDQERKSFSIHPLVHSWSQSTLKDPKSCHFWMVAIMGMSIHQTPDQDMQLSSLNLLPHIDSLIENREISPDFCAEFGCTYWWGGRSEDAKRIYLDVIEHRQKMLGEDHPDTLNARESLARTYHNLGQLKEAGEMKVLILKKRRQIQGEDHPDTLFTMGSLASTYHKLGQLKEAEELQVLVLERRQKILGEEHPDTLCAMESLAATYYKLAKCREAEELGVLVLDKRRKMLGEDHPDTLHAMGNLALTYHDLGKLKEAQELGFLVLKKKEKILGEDHPDTLREMGNLALIYHTLGQLKEAEELRVLVLEMRKKILGENHPDTLNAMNNLAATYYTLGQFTETEKLLIELLAKRTKGLGADHSYTLRTARDLADTRRAIDNDQTQESSNSLSE